MKLQTTRVRGRQPILKMEERSPVSAAQLLAVIAVIGLSTMKGDIYKRPFWCHGTVSKQWSFLAHWSLSQL